MCKRRNKIAPEEKIGTDEIDIFVFTPETAEGYFNFIREKYSDDLAKIFYNGKSHVSMEDHLRFENYRKSVMDLIEKIDEPALTKKYKEEFATLESIYRLKLVENYVTGTIGIDSAVLDLIFSK
jgi:hypothetical protein